MMFFDSGLLHNEHERPDMKRKCMNTEKALWENPKLTTLVIAVGGGTNIQSKQAHIPQCQAYSTTRAQPEPECQNRHWSGVDPEGSIGAIAPLKSKKVTIFTMIFYYSENSIRDTRPFCRPQFCYRSIVKDTSSLLQLWSFYETWLPNVTEIAPLSLLAGSTHATDAKCSLTRI